MTRKMKKEWNFIVKETHEGDRENRIKRELLLVMQCELSKPKPNICFYNNIKNIYLQENDFWKNEAYKVYEDILNGSVNIDLCRYTRETKFRLRQNCFPNLYENTTVIM